MRILMLTNMWPRAKRHRGNIIEQLVETLRELGHEVDVEVIVQGRSRWDYLVAGPRIRRKAMSGGYDLAHVHFGMTAFVGRFVGIPRVLSLYGSDVNVAWKRWVTKLGWGRGATRIYVSRRLAIAAGDPDGLVIPNGVDFRVFAPGDRAAARVTLGIRPDEKVVLFG